MAIERSPAFWIALLCAVCAGCTSSCEERELAPPPAIEGRLPELPVEERPTPRPAKESCGVLVIPEIEEGPAPLRVQLSAEGDCTEGEAIFTWDFGDGSPPATGPTVTHTFEKPGKYRVEATIRSSANPDLVDSDFAEISVLPGS